MPNSKTSTLEQFEYFAQCTSHTLSDPVRKIIAICNDNNQDPNIKTIQHDAEELLNTIKDLRKYSFFCLKQPKFNTFSAEQLLSDVQDIIKNEIAQSNTTLTINNSLQDLTADKTQLTEALIEFIRNAIKFTKKDSAPNIQITCTQEPDNYLFSVKDNGLGISTPYQDKIFTLSLRGDNSANINGNGIGLACVKAIADQHNGSTWVQSEENAGSTFYLSISNQLTPTQYP